jgi:hypothetical protein
MSHLHALQVSIYVGEKRCISDDEALGALRKTKKKVGKARDLLQLSRICKKGGGEITLALEKLNTSSERDVQLEIVKAIAGMSALDTSASRGVSPVFLPLQKDSNIITDAGKVDILCCPYPGGLELKHEKVTENMRGKKLGNQDYEVLYDVTFCIQMHQQQHGHLSHAVYFAASANSSWVVVFQRTLWNDGTMENVHYFRLKRTDIEPLWMDLNALSAAKPNWYLTKDGERLGNTRTTSGVLQHLHPV